MKLGQVFLIDHNIARKIVDSADLQPDDTVVEIGPGWGILTGYLIEKVKNLIAIEIDKKMCEYLQNKFKDKITIINSDFLKFNIKKIKSIKYVSNLPYYISSPILEKVLPARNWKSAIFMLQKEFAERVIAETNSKNYSPLSIFAQFYSEPKILFKVSRNCFRPIPEVDSVVVRFYPKRKKSIIDKEKFFTMVKSVFKYRRKTLLNSLHYAFAWNKEDIITKLQKVKINPNLRAENLTIDDYLKLSSLL